MDGEDGPGTRRRSTRRGGGAVVVESQVAAKTTGRGRGRGRKRTSVTSVEVSEDPQDSLESMEDMEQDHDVFSLVGQSDDSDCSRKRSACEDSLENNAKRPNVSQFEDDNSSTLGVALEFTEQDRELSFHTDNSLDQDFKNVLTEIKNELLLESESVGDSLPSGVGESNQDSLGFSNVLSDQDSSSSGKCIVKSETTETVDTFSNLEPVNGSLVEPSAEVKKEQKEEDESNDSENLGSEKAALDQETEMVSEDELAEPTLKVPSDAEAVSDEELPNSGDAIETEAVSDEELPVEAKKKKENDSTPKSEENDDEQVPEVKNEEVADKVTKSRSKLLPELEKYWKAVDNDPTDFTGWTYLLQYVDQENDVDAAREAYDSFLRLYPYCYGYWRKYADYEKKRGNKAKCEEVFERGLKAISLSVDLWLHYLNNVKAWYKDDEEYIRKQYERALEVCGLEFRSDRLWDSYIKWETDNKNLQQVRAIYDRLISIPTFSYTTHFEHYEEFIMSSPPNKILHIDEFLQFRTVVLQELKLKRKMKEEDGDSAPPGDDSDHEFEESPSFVSEEVSAIKEKIVASRKKMFKKTVAAVLCRWNFEEGIKRPYFHVKPLERCQLNNWREYLEYEIEQGDVQRTLILFERCLIACALYDEFWLKYLWYLENSPKVKEAVPDLIEKIQEVYTRACTVHHPKKPLLSLNWATFEENLGNHAAARAILTVIDKEVPNLLHIAIRRINLERRFKQYDEVCKLYEHYISASKNNSVMATLSIKYARFCWKWLNDLPRGVQVLKKAVDKDRRNPQLYLQLLELTLLTSQVEESDIVGIINQFLEQDIDDIEEKVMFAQRKVELLEDFGSSVKSVHKAVTEYLNLNKLAKDKKRKAELERVRPEETTKKSKSESTSQATTQSSGSSSSNYNSSYSTAGYQANSQYSQPYSGSYQYPQDTNYNYQSWGYSQPTTYTNNYQQTWTGTGYNYYS